ncbi:hypothetical protein [Pseudomonas protegens]|uniref:hypothetical protein n=1 Tax=Pseudomonas protegens TaxID=380021 RepID=UPI000CD118E9|nr:hypothetical protein [Pseudomonas protegens]POA81153.1 hypothetical protein C1883_30945 [Pseudomonas protegens]
MTEASGNQKTIDKVENWVFPLKVGATRSIDPQQYYKALAKAEDGFYPIGVNGLWHGGVHFDDASGLVSDKTEVRCIADGEVVAYRIDKTYPVSEYGSKSAPFSTGFVLVRHRLELPAPPASPATAGPSLIFFSLYMHLLDWQGYQTSPALKRPGFWDATYKVKAAASDKLLGLRVRSSDSGGNTPILTVLPRGTTVFTKPAPDTQRWLEVVDVIPAVAELAEQTGWVFKEEMQRISADQYFVGDKARDLPSQQKNGAIVRDAFAQGRPIGFLPVGTQIRISDEKNSGKYRKLLEIVSGESMPVLVPEVEGVLPGYVSLDLLDAMSRPGDMDKVVPLKTAYKVKAGELLGHVGKYQNQSDSAPKNLLHLEVFSCEDVKTFIQQSRATAANLPAKDRTLVKVAKDAKLISHVAGMSATTPPKASDPGHQIGYDLIIPLQVLESLPPEKKIKAPVVMGGLTTYTYWWHLEGMLADVSGNAISGWFAEPDIALSRHSSFEWEGFTFLEETVSHVEHYAAFLEAQKELTEEELATYQPELVKAGAGPVTQSLYKILDKDGDKKLLPDEIREALGKPWFSQPISQMLVQYESEWDYKADQWDSLDELMKDSESQPNKDWVEEKTRIEKLSWWGHGVDQSGTNEGSKVWSVHPVGMISMFFTGAVCSCSGTITPEQMKAIAPYATQANIDKYTDLLAEMYQRSGIATCISKVHVLAQMLHESGSLQFTVEIVDPNDPPGYSPYIGRGLIQITFQVNYRAYGHYVGESFEGLPNYHKMAQLPHSVLSVGWYWSEYKKLTLHSDADDFIYCTALVNGGFNGYDDRLQFLNRALRVLDMQGCTKLNNQGVYGLVDSKAYDKAKLSFAWGLWSDPGGGKNGKTKDQAQAIIGYRRFLELYDADPAIGENAVLTYYAPGRTATVAKQYAEARLLALGGAL